MLKVGQELVNMTTVYSIGSDINSIVGRFLKVFSGVGKLSRVPSRVLQSCNPDLKFSCNPVIPRVIFGIPLPKHTFNPQTHPDFAFKS